MYEQKVPHKPDCHSCGWQQHKHQWWDSSVGQQSFTHTAALQLPLPTGSENVSWCGSNHRDSSARQLPCHAHSPGRSERVTHFVFDCFHSQHHGLLPPYTPFWVFCWNHDKGFYPIVTKNPKALLLQGIEGRVLNTAYGEMMVLLCIAVIHVTHWKRKGHSLHSHCPKHVPINQFLQTVLSCFYFMEMFSPIIYFLFLWIVGMVQQILHPTNISYQATHSPRDHFFAGIS